MLRRLSHRGPDAEGNSAFNFDSYSVYLGHRRLSIIDVTGGAQPMWTREKDACVTFNGEIFNFLEIRENLRARGARFETRSDTEVLLQTLREAFRDPDRLEGALSGLNGMFAFGYLDSQNKRLLLARDRYGIKPLYYAPLADGGIAFASELAPLLELPEDLFDHTLDLQGVSDFFFHDYVAAPGTIVRGIRKLGPGEYLLWQPGRELNARAYWSPAQVLPRQGKGGNALDEQELAEELRTLLTRAVRRQLISDVPVGVFLSGGVDSSIVAALAEAESPGKLRTFSVGFTEASFDESGYAREVARILGTAHHEETLTESQMLSSLDSALDCLDEPMADASILPTYLVARLARTQVKVCLGGDGSDELWAGYPFYSAHRYGNLYGHLPATLRENVITPLVRGLPVRDTYQSLEWKAKRFVNRWDRDPGVRHMRWLAGTDLRELELLSRRPLPLPSLLPAASALIESEADPLNGFLRLDLGSYLPGSVLAKLDRATMGNGLEARPPFLDNDVVEFALSLPHDLKLRDGVSKYLLKRSARGLVPDRALDRRKQGFSVPISRWLRSRLRDRIGDEISSSRLVRAGILDGARLRQVFQEHQAAERDWGKTLWSVMIFEHWYRRNSERLRTD